jgi:hypothetical protein
MQGSSVATAQVTLTPPRTVVQSAEQVATRAPRDMETVLAEWLDRGAVEALDDASVLALADLMFGPGENVEFRALLGDNSEGRLDETGRRRLDELMEVYDRLQLLKAEALVQAVTRGLREPLSF